MKGARRRVAPRRKGVRNGGGWNGMTRIWKIYYKNTLIWNNFKLNFSCSDFSADNFWWSEFFMKLIPSIYTDLQRLSSQNRYRYWKPDWDDIKKPYINRLKHFQAKTWLLKNFKNLLKMISIKAELKNIILKLFRSITVFVLQNLFIVN